ncbi:Chromate resistance protein ChrB, partial [Amycolatopsis sp. NPDC059090]|uniref:Chromate resistance protein ChrB n=1 Tax=Amycolatopsis sp. NPDC059090 TaxID=3346723 RepID=UPI00366B882A
MADDKWLVLVVRVPSGPSRHRVAVWRELRRVGALSLGQGAWAVPDVPGFAGGVARVAELAERGEGEVITLDAAERDLSLIHKSEPTIPCESACEAGWGRS